RLEGPPRRRCRRRRQPRAGPGQPRCRERRATAGAGAEDRRLGARALRRGDRARAADRRSDLVSADTVKPAQPAPFLKAAGLMLLSTTFFGLMAVVIRLASDAEVPTVEIAFFRNFFGLLALLPFLHRSGSAVFRTRQLPRYFIRCAIGVASMLCGFWAIGNRPMAQAISLSYSAPLFVTIFAVIWLGEVVRRRRWTAVVLGFIGVLVIVRPGTEGFSAGSLVAVAAALLSSVVAIQIKQLSRVDAPDTIVFYTYVFWVPLSLAQGLLDWVWPSGITWLWLGAIGVLGTGGE